MRNLILALLAVVLFASPVHAIQTSTVSVDAEAFTSTSDFIEGTTVNIADSERVTFFAAWDRTASTDCATAIVTAAMSLNGTDWQDISWFDTVGGLTPQTSQTLSGDQVYIGYIDPIIIAPYIRIGVWFTGDETTSTGSITVTIIEDK